MDNRISLPIKVKELFVQEFGPAEGPKEDFECKECTRCCETIGKEVVLTLPDIHRLSKHFGQTMPETFEQHLQLHGAPMFMVHQFLPDTQGDVPLAIQIPMPCKFLHENYQEGRRENCTVNAEKPTICL